MREQKDKSKNKKSYEIILTPCLPTHTLIWINHRPPIPKYKPIHISTNSSYLRNVIWQCTQWNRGKWLLWKKSWRGRKQLYIKQLLSTGAGKKNQRTPSIASLPSSNPLHKLKVVLMWSCLLSLTVSSYMESKA